MRRSRHGRAATGRGPGRRVVIAVATLATFGVLIGVTQVSRAETDNASAAPTPTNSGGAPGNGPQILGDNCDGSGLQPHTGFQEGNRCVSTAFGEVAEAAQNPTLLITEAPETVRVGEPFRLTVSTRNLVHDRFLGAAADGYYLESAFLTEEGLTRGHFHTACRMLTSTREAVDPAPVPAFFVATEDGRGGAEPDSVAIQVPGLPAAGIAQCAAWAGDGSHRIPMMQRANQVPALDAVRIEVRKGGEEPPAEEPPAEEPPADEPPAQQPGRDDPGQEPDQQEPDSQEPDGQPAPGQSPDGAQPSAAEDDDPAAAATTPPAAPAGNGAGDEGGPTGGELADDSSGRLAFTGVNTIVLFAAGALLIIAGIAISYLARQRRYRTVRR